MSRFLNNIIFIAITFVLLWPLNSIASPRMIGGIQVNESDHDFWVSKLKADGMNTIPVTVYAHQGDWDSSNLWFDEENLGVIEEIRAAKRGGLGVVLILRVALDHAFKRNKHLWHGMIMPKSEADLDEWFRRYRKFVLKWGKIAEDEGVDVLGVGSEMNALASTVPILKLPDLETYYLDTVTQHENRLRLLDVAKGHEPFWDQTFPTFSEYLIDQTRVCREWAMQVSFNSNVEKINERRKYLEQSWRGVAKAARSVFSRRTTYAANFDQYQKVSFWKDLDIVGINAYFKVRDKKLDRDLSSVLESGWTKVVGDIQSYLEKNSLSKKPVLFTELGYTFRKFAAVAPWAGSGYVYNGGELSEFFVVRREPEDFSERVEALKGLRTALKKYPKLKFSGILYWKFSTNANHREIEPFVVVLNDEKDSEFVRELRNFL